MTAQRDDLCYWTASEAIAAFKAKTLSPVELLDAVIARIDTVNPKLNAFTETYFDRARDQAKAAEQAYGGGRARPLEGVPVAIKDFHAVAGELTTLGSAAFADNRPSHTAPTVARLLEAGAIMHARTTTPEFAYAPKTASPLWGITRNPWNLDMAPGGSSGGAGAALAAGMTTLADGTDAGGSVRIPAAACHIVGYKAPFGRNPLDIDHPIESLLHYGPMARSVGDTALMQNVMSGPHVDDMCSLREPITVPAEPKPIKGCKIAFSMDLGMFEIDSQVARNTEAALDVFRGLGCTVNEVTVPWGGFDLPHPYLRYWEGMAATSLGPLLDEWRDKMDPYMVRIIENGRDHTAGTLYRCNPVRGAMYQSLAPILEEHDFLVCPSLAVPTVAADHDCGAEDFQINGKPVHAYLGWNLCYPFNMLSQCPVMAVPSGLTDEGLPTGIQIVGRTFDDLSVFRAAAAYEAANPWRDTHPPI
jgi:amidase